MFYTLQKLVIETWNLWCGLFKSTPAISFYAAADFDRGIGIFKIKVRTGKIIEKGPIIHYCEDQREAAAILRTTNCGGEAV